MGCFLEEVMPGLRFEELIGISFMKMGEKAGEQTLEGMTL